MALFYGKGVIVESNWLILSGSAREVVNLEIRIMGIGKKLAA